MLWFVAFTALQAPPAVKNCPDGTTIRVTETCLSYPDHRRLTPSAPQQLQTIVRWRCGTTWTSVTVNEISSYPQGIRRSVSVTVGGRHIRRERLIPLTLAFNDKGAPPIISGRCLAGPTGRLRPVLTLLRGGELDRSSREYALD